MLSSLQTLWVREHNRICDELISKTSGLTDEQIYQKARSKVMGLLQHITYNEFLPAVLGDDILSDYKGYDSNVNPGIFNEFAAAAYRFGHSMISDTVALREHDGSVSQGGDIHLRDAFFNIQVLQQTGIDTVLRGASLQQAQEIDTEYVDGLRNFLFATPPEGSKCPMRGILRFTNGVFPGLDLGSRNIQRGRDHGLNSYNDVRESIGLKRLNSFEEITSDKEIVGRLKDLYNDDINNVDLYVAGLAEDHVSGSSLGETFREIVKQQFEAIRDGDRFWYENTANKLFTNDELTEIKATRLSDVIQRNTEITGLRDNVFFISINGSDQDDVLQGTHLADEFIASIGNDVINGSSGLDSIDYTSIEGPISLRFDGVLKGSNIIDELGLTAWEDLQNLANEGNKVAKKIFSLHASFFGKSTSGFFDNGQQSEATILVNETTDKSDNLGFDQINDIESIEADKGSTVDGRGATESIDVDLKANSFRTNFFGHAVELIIKGFSNAIGSISSDNISGDANNNVLLGLSGTDSLKGGAGDDHILSGDGNDFIQGDSGNDKLYGGFGDDNIQGGEGNDVIDGGAGTDIAVFTGKSDEYYISKDAETGWYTFEDSIKNRDGNDQIMNIEHFQFSDKILDQINLDDDILIGKSLKIKESEGSVDLLVGVNNLVFAKESQGNAHAITRNGQQIGDNSWPDLSIVAAETINEDNQFVAQDIISGDLKIFSADTKWAAKSHINLTSDSPEYLIAESNFGIDFNSNGIIGG